MIVGQKNQLLRLSNTKLLKQVEVYRDALQAISDADTEIMEQPELMRDFAQQALTAYKEEK